MAMAAMGGRYNLWKKAISKVKFSTSSIGSMYDSRLLRRRSGGDVIMTANEIEKLKRESLKEHIEFETELADCNDPEFPGYIYLMERVSSKNRDVLKGLLKDLRKLNRKNMNKLERRHKKKELIEKKEQEERELDMEDMDGAFDSRSMFHVEDQATAHISRFIVQGFNHRQNSKLEFARTIDIVEDPFPTDFHLLIEARDPNAASVPIKLQALYNITDKEFKVNVVKPVPFMKLKLVDEKLRLEERETLLYANLRDCPIIAKRLGLKGWHEVFSKLIPHLRLPYDDYSRPLFKYDVQPPYLPFHKYSPSISPIKMSLDCEKLLNLAMFAVHEQNDNQVSHLKFIRVVGAWREVLVYDRYIDHMMLEALEDGVGKSFYAALVSEPSGRYKQLLQWVPTHNSHKITFNQGGKV